MRAWCHLCLIALGPHPSFLSSITIRENMRRRRRFSATNTPLGMLQPSQTHFNETMRDSGGDRYRGPRLDRLPTIADASCLPQQMSAQQRLPVIMQMPATPADTPGEADARQIYISCSLAGPRCSPLLPSSAIYDHPATSQIPKPFTVLLQLPLWLLSRPCLHEHRATHLQGETLICNVP
ncbi:hypothetical protein FKP32DRAFT_1444678 [Trametes sanguinea]|nr:hypothetical protein FKP32DRAFT_1444678 [Trametes sanguinea]